jgi:predicted PurR-regulated permease PerM
LILIAVIIALIFAPLVDFLEKKRVPRLLTTIFIYLFILAVVVGLVIPLAPVLSQEVNALLQKLPDYYDKINQYFNISNKSLEEIIKSFLINWLSVPGTATKGLFSIVGTIFGSILVVILIFVIAFYLNSQKKILREIIKKITPTKYHQAMERMGDLIQKDIGGWARGLLIGALVVGVLDYIGLLVVGVKFALLLGVLGALGELIPWVGTWAVSIFTVLVALVQSPLQALMIAIYYLLVQQLQGNFVVPKLMQRFVGLNPLLVIIAVLVGGKLAGVAGLVLAVPLLTIVIILIKEYLHIKQEKLLDKS